MAKYVAEVIAFFLILAVLWRYVVPPIRKAMQHQQEAIRAQFTEARQAKEHAEAAEAEFNSSINDADTERDELLAGARSQAEQILEEFRVKAEQEAQRIGERARSQLAAERDAVVRELRAQTGRQVVALAGRIVGEALADEARRAATVGRFLTEMQQRPAETSTVATAG